MKYMGYWNNDSCVHLYQMNDGRKIAVSDWNGEMWGECWEVFPDGSACESFAAHPVYRHEVEGIDIAGLEENSPEWDRAVEVVDIEKC